MISPYADVAVLVLVVVLLLVGSWLAHPNKNDMEQWRRDRDAMRKR